MRIALCVLMVACFVAYAEDDLTADATQFIEKHTTPSEREAWIKWWTVRAEELQRDHGDANEEAAADGYLTAWLRDRREKFEKHRDKIGTKDKITLCHFYLLYKRSGWAIPERVGEHITKKNYDEIFNKEDK
jgi:hypothetical protein